jgi:hypothetical protein
MLLMKIVPDDTMAVPGFEHHTFMCSACYDVERRLVFRKPAEAVPVHAAPPIVPGAMPVPVEHVDTAAVEYERTAAAEHGRAASPGILMRVFAKLRGGDPKRS